MDTRIVALLVVCAALSCDSSDKKRRKEMQSTWRETEACLLNGGLKKDETVESRLRFLARVRPQYERLAGWPMECKLPVDAWKRSLPEGETERSLDAERLSKQLNFDKFDDLNIDVVAAAYEKLRKDASELGLSLDDAEPRVDIPEAPTPPEPPPGYAEKPQPPKPPLWPQPLAEAPVAQPGNVFGLQIADDGAISFKTSTDNCSAPAGETKLTCAKAPSPPRPTDDEPLSCYVTNAPDSYAIQNLMAQDGHFAVIRAGGASWTRNILALGARTDEQYGSSIACSRAGVAVAITWKGNTRVARMEASGQKLVWLAP